MTAVEMLLNNPLFQAGGGALVLFIGRGARVAWLYGGRGPALRGRAANLRYALACAAMLLMLMLPAATVFVIARSSSQAPGESLAVQATASVTAPTDGRRQAIADGATPFVGFGASQSVPVASSQTVAAAADSPSPSWRLWARPRFVALMPWLVAVRVAGRALPSLRFL